MHALDRYIQEAQNIGATDIHLVPGSSVMCRNANGEFAALSEQPLSSEDVGSILEPLLSIHDKAAIDEALQQDGDVDVSYMVGQEGQPPVRCRVNIFREERGIAVAFRLLKKNIPTRQELRLPTITEHLIRKKNGLIIFTAPTGNGKTTSIAALLELINSTMGKRIITIEDPVEYRFEQKKSIISQREVGTNCSSFARGLRSALREDPDIILVGEMRDKDTILTALSAAETGHLVFTTLHAPNVVEAIDRLTQYFDGPEQNTVRMQTANALLAIIAQQLLPKKGGGKIAAFEVLTNSSAISNLIRETRTFSIPSYMDKGKGMQHMEESISELRLLGLLE